MRSKGLFLAPVLAVGFGAVWCAFGLWGAEVVQHVAGIRWKSARLMVLADGTAVIAESNAGGEVAYRGLDGQPVERTGERMFSVGNSFLPPEPTGEGDYWAQRILAFADGGSPSVFWYFLGDGAGHFVGYDSHSKARVGYLGTAGFRGDCPPPEELFPRVGNSSGLTARVVCTQAQHGFTGHPRKDGILRAPAGALSGWDVFVLGADQLYHVDLRRRTVRRVAGLPLVRSAFLALGLPDPVRGTPCYVAARTDGEVLILDVHGAVRKRYPIPDALRGELFWFGETAAGEGLMQTRAKLDTLAATTEQSVYWVKPDGRFRVASVTLPRPRGINLPVAGGGIVPSPVALAGLVATAGVWELREAGLEVSYPEALGYTLRVYRPALLIAQLTAVVFAALCYRRQARYGGGRVAWPLFVLVFGLPGYVGYRFGRTWPALEACPGCEAEVPADREACVRCEATLPAPPLRGTEVFA